MLSRWLSYARRDCFPICLSSHFPSILLPLLPKLRCHFGATGQNPSNRLHGWSHFIIINLKTFTFLGKQESVFFLNKCYEIYIKVIISLKWKISPIWKHWGRNIQRTICGLPFQIPPSPEAQNCAQEGPLHCCYLCQHITRCGHLNSQHRDLWKV